MRRDAMREVCSGKNDDARRAVSGVGRGAIGVWLGCARGRVRGCCCRLCRWTRVRNAPTRALFDGGLIRRHRLVGVWSFGVCVQSCVCVRHDVWWIATGVALVHDEYSRLSRNSASMHSPSGLTPKLFFSSPIHRTFLHLCRPLAHVGQNHKS